MSLREVQKLSMNEVISETRNYHAEREKWSSCNAEKCQLRVGGKLCEGTENAEVADFLFQYEKNTGKNGSKSTKRVDNWQKWQCHIRCVCFGSFECILVRPTRHPS